MSDIIRINGWVRKLTGTGTVYYVKRKTGETRWDHPGLTLALESLCKYDNIRYAAYRLSSKLLSLSELLGTLSISLNLLVSTTSHHGIVAPSIILDSQFIRDILHDLYTAGGVRNSTLQLNSTIYSEAMANLIEQLLDPAHQGGVTSLGLKTVIAVFSRARLREKLVYLFREHAHKGILGQTELTYMLSILSRIPELLGEGVMFGSGVVGGAVHSALQVGGGRGVTQEAWLYWAGRDPPELVWMTTSYRLLSGSGVRHGIICSACSREIIGLRYQCLQCLKYDLCQGCFFTGASSRGHRPKHPVQEYCYPSSRGDQLKAVLATLVNKIKPKAILKQRKKLTRKLTVDKYEGMKLVEQYRNTVQEADKQLFKIPEQREGTLSRKEQREGTLSRQELLRKPLRRPGSKNVSPRDEHDYAAPMPRGDIHNSHHLLRPGHPTLPSGHPGHPEYPGHAAYSSEEDGGYSPVYDRISPSSSGFCSGSDSHSSEIRSKEPKNTSPKREKPPRKTREKSFRKAQDVRPTDDILKSRESVVDLEWDDAGIQLNEDTDQEQFWRYQGQAFEHSILRRDIDTGEVVIYKIPNKPESSNNTLDERDEMQGTPTFNKDEIFSIIGHLENDEKRLTAKLRHSPDLVKPITEAQEQLKRLKNLMFDIFGPKQLPEETEVDKQLNLTGIHEESLALKTTFDGQHQIESTRLDGENNYTPKQFKQSDFVFSPIVFDTDQDNTGKQTNDETDGNFDLSFTRYQLSDLTDRLGGTGLSYSKTSLLEISEKLRDAAPNDMSGSCKEAVDELEHLMHSLNNLFENFSPKSFQNISSDETVDESVDSGESGRVLKIVAEINKLLGNTKETKI